MKNRSTMAFFRVLLIFGVILIITEFFYKTGADPAFVSNPSVALFLILVLFTLITIEGVNSATNKLGKSDDELATETLDGESAGGLKGFLKKMWNAKPIAQEQDILLDHDYDGIKELDNSLPPWWLYSFYISIVFAALYLGYYHILGGDTQEEEFNKQMEIARIEVENYKRANPVVLDAGEMSTADNLAAGKKIFVANCAACHAFDGGGGYWP